MVTKTEEQERKDLFFMSKEGHTDLKHDSFRLKC